MVEFDTSTDKLQVERTWLAPGRRSAMTELSESFAAQRFPALLFADDRRGEGARLHSL
jgi:hypothetical protein